MRWCPGPALDTRRVPKLDVGLAKGKKQHDKRPDEKDRDWERQKAGTNSLSLINNKVYIIY